MKTETVKVLLQYVRLVLEYITAMDIRISKTYMYEAYDSCKQVSYPSTGKLVLDVACGKWASTYCTPER